MNIRKLEVFEDSIGAFIGFTTASNNVERVSLYYQSTDQAKAELDDGSWQERVKDKAHG